MALPVQNEFEEIDNPLDVVEHMAVQNKWVFDRNSENEINLAFQGQWGDYHLTVSWRDQIETLHLTCALELRVPANRRQEMQALLNLINEQLWIGHFEMWDQEGQIAYRYGLLLAAVEGASLEQCQSMIEIAVDACDRFYPACQYVIWAGKTAKDAAEAALFETAGTA
ncbi:MAG TPA: hypothetical protein DCL54_16570 [Alphaproteobacteria bacterium]|nr:hypothetical protein [Alphaproteobacteria bacterium]HAJ48189.1 hypothetical protein [Alphaproteobacteria bacterium]